MVEDKVATMHLNEVNVIQTDEALDRADRSRRLFVSREANSFQLMIWIVCWS